MKSCVSSLKGDRWVSRSRERPFLTGAQLKYVAYLFTRCHVRIRAHITVAINSTWDTLSGAAYMHTLITIFYRRRSARSAAWMATAKLPYSRWKKGDCNQTEVKDVGNGGTGDWSSPKIRKSPPGWIRFSVASLKGYLTHTRVLVR